MLLSQGTILCQNVMVVNPIEYMLMIKLKNINIIYLKNKGKLNPIDSILCDFHRLFSFHQFWGLCEPVYVGEEIWKYLRTREVVTETKSKENINFLYNGEKNFYSNIQLKLREDNNIYFYSTHQCNLSNFVTSSNLMTDFPHFFEYLRLKNAAFRRHM